MKDGERKTFTKSRETIAQRGRRSETPLICERWGDHNLPHTNRPMMQHSVAKKQYLMRYYIRANTVKFLFLMKWRLDDRVEAFHWRVQRSAGVSHVVRLSLVWLVSRHRWKESAESQEKGSNRVQQHYEDSFLQSSDSSLYRPSSLPNMQPMSKHTAARCQRFGHDVRMQFSASRLTL